MIKILNTADKSSIKVIRMNGAGNTFAIHDSRNNEIKVNEDFINYLLDNKKIKKFDQFIEISKSENNDAKVKFWNIDGSEAEMCGNALRCISSLILNKDDIEECYIETIKRNVKCWKKNEKIFVDIGKPILSWNEIPLKGNNTMDSTIEIELLSPPCDLPKFSAVNVGNPHAVFFFDDKTPNIFEVGKSIEENEMFPNKVNVSFAKVIDNKNIELNVWERGAGITQACGSAACATAVASANLGYTKRDVNVILPGGNIEINWQNDNHIVMTGPYEFDGEDIVNISDYK